MMIADGNLVQERILGNIATNLERLLDAAARRANPLTREEVAEAAEMSRANLYDLLAQKNRQPSVIRLVKLASVLDASLEELLGDPAGKPARASSGVIPDLQVWDPSITSDELEMLASIRWAGRRPASTDRWLFVLDALRSSRSIDQRYKLGERLPPHEVERILQSATDSGGPLRGARRGAFLQMDFLAVPPFRWKEWHDLVPGLDEIIDTSAHQRGALRKGISRHDTFRVAEAALEAGSSELSRVALEACAGWARSRSSSLRPTRAGDRRHFDGRGAEPLELFELLRRVRGSHPAEALEVLVSSKLLPHGARASVEVASALLYFTGNSDWAWDSRPGGPLIYSRRTEEALGLLGWSHGFGNSEAELNPGQWLQGYDRYLEDLDNLSRAVEVDPDQLQRMLESVDLRQFMKSRFDA